MKTQTKRLCRQLLVATLLMGGAFNMTAPVLALGTAAGTGIVNRATATYEDPNNPGTSINATSNTVTIQVAEVAGITVISKAVTDQSPATPLGTNDTVYFDFEVTNTGNDTTQFYIPDAAQIAPGVSGGTIITSGANSGIQYSTDGGTTWLARPTTSGAEGIVGSIAPDKSILVRVPVLVTANAANANVVVTLGNTGSYDANNVGTGTQDQPDVTDGANANEVRTVDVSGEAVPNDGLPANGEREASARGVIKLGATREAFARVTKTHSGYSNNNTASDLTDDTLTYNLGLDVVGVSPDPQLSAGNLVGLPIDLDGIQQTKILVSDRLPAQTELASVANNLPANWIAVYSSDDTTTPAHQVDWLTYNSGVAASSVKRIGFVYDDPNTTNDILNAGQSVTGLSFTVKTTGVTTTTKIANIAQVFAYTEGGTTVIYDESGDQNPNNYEGSTRPGTNNPTDGIANPANNGEDTGNNNSVINNPGGEDNVYTISTPGAILNGPYGKPEAINTDTNDDFTNKSSAIATNIDPGTSTSPATITSATTVTFQNTIKNPGSATINNLLLVPTPPSNTAHLQNGTIVKLKYGTAPNQQTATYTYNGSTFAYSPASGDTAIVINGLGGGADISYTVEITLPAGTPLSTDINRGFPVPIVAFVDQNNNGTFELPNDSTTYNITIDRVYTGFLKLTKEARILDAANNATDYTGWFTTPSATQALEIRPGRIIEYRIKYENISELPQAGTGVNNIQLNAGTIVILEDGTVSPNTWAKDNDNSGAIDTNHVAGKATDTNSGVIEYYDGSTGNNITLGTSDPGANATVTMYKDTLPSPLPPTGSGYFTFQRKLDIGATGP